MGIEIRVSLGVRRRKSTYRAGMLLRPFRADYVCDLYPGRRFALPRAGLLEPFRLRLGWTIGALKASAMMCVDIPVGHESMYLSPHAILSPWRCVWAEAYPGRGGQ